MTDKENEQAAGEDTSQSDNVLPFPSEFAKTIAHIRKCVVTEAPRNLPSSVQTGNGLKIRPRRQAN